jgi:1-aminocyclopropane-1-carboxylate deaminase/D-cysteine desulfhydrase-like pyridoxal-dependent ACC family enzyme
VTFGGLQSNHARITAAAANRLGLEAHLFYFEKRPARLTGNLLINELLGTKMHFLPIGGGGDGRMTLELTIRLVHLLARLWVGSSYFIPVGGHSWLGCLGYVAAAVEIQAQAAVLGLDEVRLVTAAGSGGTLAGLWAGFALLDAPIRPLGIDVGNLWKDFAISLASLTEAICKELAETRPFSALDVPLIEKRYVGERYGVPSPAGNEALKLLAQTEGILLDPVYTAKAFAGMLDLLKRGAFGEKEPLIFLHTGGFPALFA